MACACRVDVARPFEKGTALAARSAVGARWRQTCATVFDRKHIQSDPERRDRAADDRL